MMYQYQPMRDGKEYGKPEGWPMFIAEEKYGGCCARFANCWVCCECCQDEMRFHNGGDDFMNTRDGNARYAPSKAGECDVNDLLAIGKVPIGGGGCTPTIETFQVAPGDAGDKLNVEGKKPIYVVE